MLLLQIAAEKFQICSGYFLPKGPRKLRLVLFIFWVFFFFSKISEFTIVPYGETKNPNYLENELS